MNVQTTARHASFDDLVQILKQQQAVKVDVVAPASHISSQDGVIRVKDAEVTMDETGVSSKDGLYKPTRVFDEGVAGKLGIPMAYLQRMRDERVDLYDSNVNGWLRDDQRSFLVRAFSDGSGPGVARALTSDSFKIIDHLDVLTASIQGIHDAGMADKVSITGCDLTDRTMRVRVSAPDIAVYAKELVKNYRSPFSGDSGADLPLVFAGFDISNSETGSGALTITPRLTVQVCSNGLRITKDVFRQVHLGGKLDSGTIRWSDETQQKVVELVTLKTRDAVTTFLDVEYMTRVVRDLEAKAQQEVDGAPDQVIRRIGKTLSFSEDVTDGVLSHFIKGGDLSAGGVLHAVTSYAQVVDDGDVAANMEAQAFRAMELAMA